MVKHIAVLRRAMRRLSLTLALVPALSMAAPALQSYNVDESQISVSGLSSGGFMASQLHVAYSSTFMGAGVVAGGVYYCAEGNQMNATGRCMDSGSLPSGGYFADIAKNLASNGKIDATSNMSGDKVWIFSGAYDSVVRTESSDRARDFYEYFTDSTRIAYSRNQLRAEHAMPTMDYGNGCTYKGDPYINDCDYDAAGELLQHIYGGLNGRTSQKSGNLLEFDQSEFTSSFYVGSTGYIYVPDACENGTTCKLHVALHGCVQNKDDIGDQFARHAGYNQWAEANDIIVVYPQTSMSATNSCWDWWGYIGSDYHTQTGDHMEFVKAVVDHIAGGSTGGGGDDGGGSFEGYCGTDSNGNHKSAGRAYSSWGYYYAVGSDEYIGYGSSTESTLEETSSDYYQKTTDCPTDDGGDGGTGGGGDGSFQCQDWYTTNGYHEYYGRAYYSSGYYTQGADDYLGGLSGSYTWVKETSSGYFEAGSCP